MSGMKLICCGSGSTGNTYILTNGDEALVLDCGIRFLEVKKALGFNIRPIVGAVVSHVHGDHHAYAHEYEAAGIPVWRPYTAESLRQDKAVGGFRVQSFGLVHDVPCCGFLVGHKDLGKLVYITDTEYVRYRFKGLNTILIEANYDERYIDTTQAKTRHVLTGHQSLQTAMKFIEANASDCLNHVILCHLSQSGSASPKEFLEAVKEIVPAGCTVDIAEKGLVSDLSDTPF
jgi:ribonuclease BN (tRNA processing enzyme)